MPLGLQFTVTYRIITQENSQKESTSENEPVEAESTLNLLNSTVYLTQHRLYLEEERSVLALKPLSKIMALIEGPIAKTQPLTMVLEQLYWNGMDMASALAILKGSLSPDSHESWKAQGRMNDRINMLYVYYSVLHTQILSPVSVFIQQSPSNGTSVRPVRLEGAIAAKCMARPRGVDLYSLCVSFHIP